MMTCSTFLHLEGRIVRTLEIGPYDYQRKLGLAMAPALPRPSSRAPTAPPIPGR